MSEGAQLALGLVVWALVTAVILVLVFRKVARGMPRKKLAQVEADPGTPFSLSYTPAQPQRLRVFLRYHLSSAKLGGNLETGVSGLLGLACALKIEIGGEPVAEEVIGYGSPLPRKVDRMERRSYFGRTSWVGDSLTKTGSIPLCEIARVPAGAEVEATGTIELNSSTTAAALMVFFSL